MDKKAESDLTEEINADDDRLKVPTPQEAMENVFPDEADFPHISTGSREEGPSQRSD